MTSVLTEHPERLKDLRDAVHRGAVVCTQIEQDALVEYLDERIKGAKAPAPTVPGRRHG